MKPGLPLFLFIGIVTSCSYSSPNQRLPNGSVPSAHVTQRDAPLPGLPLPDGEHTIGEPMDYGYLTIFPVYARYQEDLGDFTTLERATAENRALVHEIGANTDGAPPPPRVVSSANVAPNTAGPTGPQGRHRRSFDSTLDGPSAAAQVNRLVIDNRGDLPILVLAGTIVKGGKQDRQIGEDLVVEPHTETEVEAFCVEPHRWTPSRDGRPTNGKFLPGKSLAHSNVRGKGQYAKDQSAVWSEVGKVNAAHGKAPATGTLLAAVDDPSAVTQRDMGLRQLTALFEKVPQSSAVVGLAYGVHGKVRGVRWFFHHKVFEQHRELLLSTILLENEQVKPGPNVDRPAPPTPPPCTPAAVVSFVDHISQAPSVEHATAAANVNSVHDDTQGWSSTVELKPNKKFSTSTPTPKTGNPPPSRHGKKSAVTTDFLEK